MMRAAVWTGWVLLGTTPSMAQPVDPHAGHAITEAAAQPAMDHSMMDHGGMHMAPTPKAMVRTNIGPAEFALKAFSDALEVGNRKLAIARLAPDLTVVEDGVEESRADYIGGHLAADIEYQKSVKTVLLERTVLNDGPSKVRIVSKIRMIGNRSDKPTDTVIEENAVLAKMPDGWKIMRLEWISAQ
ncbi:hypothetical protein GCM10007973_02390 [Polymorphobacter multimanifer]|uniref:Nuclear transport factor 2 family protein n=1 Tax=Polymorphobacter multimanifer TaxID=1070431 RepID=A0A841LHE6_9SPHN|nr:hypothetical protein [Polymorphobacter multimanifer]MBB6228622.1 hypothetical protein [Polymorphobacter multimanifer]GGI68831.1 hypothetical protein GCM10007973_02390 [Polymorphobacter multimanifer]